MVDKRVITNDEYRYYLSLSLKSGRKDNLKVCLMSHNSSWVRFQLLERKYDTFSVDCFGSGIDYLSTYKNKVSDDYDIIVLDSSERFYPSTFNKIKKMAQNIAKNKGKKVSFGYSYYVPNDKGKPSHQEARIITFDHEAMQEEHLVEEKSYILSNCIVDAVVSTYDNFIPSKALTKKKGD